MIGNFFMTKFDSTIYQKENIHIDCYFSLCRSAESGWCPSGKFINQRTSDHRSISVAT